MYSKKLIPSGWLQTEEQKDVNGATLFVELFGLSESLEEKKTTKLQTINILRGDFQKQNLRISF